jgi:hypothetical protein
MGISEQSSVPLSWRTCISWSARNGPSEVGIGHGFDTFLLQRDGVHQSIVGPGDLRDGEFEEGCRNRSRVSFLGLS